MRYVLALLLGSSLFLTGCCTTKKKACPSPAAANCCATGKKMPTPVDCCATGQKKQ